MKAHSQVMKMDPKYLSKMRWKLFGNFLATALGINGVTQGFYNYPMFLRLLLIAMGIVIALYAIHSSNKIWAEFNAKRFAKHSDS